MNANKMPARGVARSPFIGTSSRSNVMAHVSPDRPSSTSALTARSTPARHTASAHSTPRHRPAPNTDGLPSYLDTADQTFRAFADDSLSNAAVSETITRACFFDVVVEPSSQSGSSDPASSPSYATTKDIDHPLLPWLGDVVVDQSTMLTAEDRDSSMPKSASGSSINAVASTEAEKSSRDPFSSASPTDSARWLSRVQELIETERSYVRRIDVLHQKYAIPLRTLAKHRDTAIIPLYEAQRLFGNIGEIAGANRAFLNDLELLAAQGPEALRHRLGDVLYQHMSCFSCYSEYFANFDKAKHIEHTVSKLKPFRDFSDQAKYSVTGIGNTGLRDLLMEPVQRIPRYKLLIDAILKHLDPHDPQRTRFQQAVLLASRIASCEADDKTKRAAVLWSFSRNVDAFPPELISVHRQFIDCIDVDDFPLDSTGLPGGYSGSKTLHCTLFLFDDRIAIVKRVNSSSCGRKLVGLDDLNQLASQMKAITEKSASSTTPLPSKKIELAFRGSVGIMDLEATDLGGTDFQLALLRPPSHVSGEKWTSRPVRQYVVVDAAATSSAIASRGSIAHTAFDGDFSARLEKMRFLESLWRAKALFKTRDQRSHVRCQIVPASRRSGGVQSILTQVNDPANTEVARQLDARKIIYYNIYGRRSYLSEASKTSVALHINLDETQDPIPLGQATSPPHATLDILALDEIEAECTVRTTSKDGHSLSYPAIRPITDLPRLLGSLSDEVDQTHGILVRVFGQRNPGSPSSSGLRHRGRAATGIENFGRSLLFGSSTASSTVSSSGISSLDVFGSPTRRSNSNASKSTFGSNAASISSRATTFSTAPSSVSSRASAIETLSRGSGLGSPRSVRRFSRRRSSSVGPSATEVQDPQGHSGLQQRLRATTPDPQLTFNRGIDRHDFSQPLVSSSPRSSSLIGPARRNPAGSHARSKTEYATTSSHSAAPAAASYQQRQRPGSVDLSRTPSSTSRRPTGPREPTSPIPVKHQQTEPRSPEVEVPAADTESLRTQLAVLKRKCELLITLESDGRLENTEIHKAFNEELDMMYDNTQKPESFELEALRQEVKRVKTEHHSLNIAIKRIKRDLELERSQTKVYEEILRRHGLL